MSIEKYSTKSFVLKHYDNSEDNIILKLWTRDFGLIYAKSMSFKKSIKLRQHAMVNRMSDLTLVKGREYFRLAGAREIIFEDIYVSIICNIVDRLIHGEEKIVNLFDRYIEYLEFVKSEQINNHNLDTNIFKICIMLETLYILGFFDLKDINYENLKLDKNHKDYQYPEDVFLFVQLNKKLIVDYVQKSLYNTML